MKHLFSLCSLFVQLFNLIVSETTRASNRSFYFFISYNEPTPHYLPLNPHAVGCRGHVFSGDSEGSSASLANQKKERLSCHYCLVLYETGLLKYASETSRFDKAVKFRLSPS